MGKRHVIQIVCSLILFGLALGLTSRVPDFVGGLLFGASFGLVILTYVMVKRDKASQSSRKRR